MARLHRGALVVATALPWLLGATDSSSAGEALPPGAVDPFAHVAYSARSRNVVYAKLFEVPNLFHAAALRKGQKRQAKEPHKGLKVEKMPSCPEIEGDPLRVSANASAPLDLAAWGKALRTKAVESMGPRPLAHEVADGVFSYAVAVEVATAKASLKTLDATGCSRERVAGLPDGLSVRDVHTNLLVNPSNPAAVEAIVTCARPDVPLRRAVDPTMDEASDLAVCFPPLFGEVNWLWIAAWLEHHQALGVSKAFAYLIRQEPPPPHIAQRIAASGVAVQWIDASAVRALECLWYQGQQFFINDCWLRTRRDRDVRWALFMDWDEFLHINDDPAVSDFRPSAVSAGAKAPLTLRDVAAVAERTGYGMLTFGSKYVVKNMLCETPASGTLPPVPKGAPVDDASLGKWLGYWEQLLKHESFAQLVPKCCRHHDSHCDVTGKSAKQSRDTCFARPPPGRTCGTHTRCLGVRGHRKYMIRPEAVHCRYSIDQCLSVHGANGIAETFQVESQGDPFRLHTYADAVWIDHFTGLVVQNATDAGVACWSK